MFSNGKVHLENNISVKMETLAPVNYVSGDSPHLLQILFCQAWTLHDRKQHIRTSEENAK